MKKVLLASACALALSSFGAAAQTTQQPAAAASKDVPANQSTTGVAGMKDKRGDSKGMTPSGGGANTNNMGSQAGGGAGAGGGSGGGK